jgi:hypothetical protein
MITFPMPEGYTLPEGADKGTFEALATLEVTEDGGLSLVAIDGLSVSESEEETSEDDESYSEATDPDTGDFQKAVMMGMGQ